MARRGGWRITYVVCDPLRASVIGVKDQNGWQSFLIVDVSATSRPPGATVKLSAPFHAKHQRASPAAVDSFDSACPGGPAA